jgi:MoaA/NifB/PqqE/SkfB family radical SAM enzyme
LFNKIHLFYIEVLITTECTLKCENCQAYIPYIDKEYRNFMRFDNYKRYIDNLITNIETLKYLRILGGEPLLHKDLDIILKYALEQKKIKKVFLVTNGTILLPDNVLAVLKQYNYKSAVDISNYSANKKLLPRLKAKEIIDKCKENNIEVIYSRALLWAPISAASYHDRSVKDNEKYYISCHSLCVGICEWNNQKHDASHIEAGIVPCIKAGVFNLSRIGNQKENKDYISLSKPVEKADFIKFYSNNDFDVCKYCNYLKDRETSIMPAIQIDGEVKNKLKI